MPWFLIIRSRPQLTMSLFAWLIALTPTGSVLADEKPLPPIVIVVFDEIPTVSLLAADGHVDASLVPNFAELAKTSTWARGASTVATRQLQALPALLTGRLPGTERKLAIRAEFPDNLFTWLDADYELNVVEEQSLLRPDPRDAKAQKAWLVRKRRDWFKTQDQGMIFHRFVSRIGQRGRGPTPSQPTLDFIHLTLPYYPWQYTYSGYRYTPARALGNFGEIWDEQPYFAEDAWRRHLIELRLADVLLGRLLTTLRETSRFDETLLIVTTAYGAGFWPGESRRSAWNTLHPEDVLLVPFFVKRPGQKVGETTMDVVQSIDLVSTIADVLDRKPGWALDGCSIFDSACERPTTRQAFRSNSKGVLGLESYPADLHERTETLERKQALFGDVETLEASWPVGRFESWRRRPLSEVTIVNGSGPAGRVTPDRVSRDWSSSRGGPRLEATLKLEPEAVVEAEAVYVAFALNGVIEALVPVVHDLRGRSMLLVQLPEARIRPSDNDLQPYLVVGEGDSARLRALEMPAPRANSRRPKSPRVD